MDINYVSENWFRATGSFKSNIYKNGETYIIIFRSTYLEFLKEKGVETHYELHFTKSRDDNLIRISCYTFPYRQFKGEGDYEEKLLTKYSKDTTQKILAFREALRKEYIAMGKSPKEGFEYYKRDKDNNLGLISTKLPQTMSEHSVMAKVAWFIGETYETLVKYIEQYKYLLN